MNDELTIDLTYATSPLFVRQTMALAFGFPIDQEIQWRDLGEHIRKTDRDLPNVLVFKGRCSLALKFREEEFMLRHFLRELSAAHPHVKIMVVIHD